MTTKRRIEIFSAGCPACVDVISEVQSIACSSCDVEILDMNQDAVAAKAKDYGVKSVPAVAINGKLADCCTKRGVNEGTLRAAGLGMTLP